MKKSLLITTSIFVLVGCGSSSYKSPLKGYYLDSAVSGVEYNCGSYNWTTDKDGSFDFEEGKDCTFKINDLILTKLDASKLYDGIKYVVKPKVAQFLQSFDSDGDPTNGITIDDTSKNAIKNSPLLNQYKKVEDIPANVLETAIEQIKSSNSNFNGNYVSALEAENHLNSTLNSVLRILLSNKTFYMQTQSNSGVSTQIDKVYINANVDTMKILLDDGSNKVYTIEMKDNYIYLNGNKLIFVDATKNYIKFTNPNSNEDTIFYFNKP